MNTKNLLENFKIEWLEWSPRKELSPEFCIKDNNLNISTGNNPNIYGKFISNEIDALNLPVIIFEADYSCQNVKNEEKSIFAMINFYDGQKILLERSYADIVVSDDGEKKKLYRKLDSPENAAYITLEIGARWCPDAMVEWKNIKLESKEAEPPRIARIATTYKEQCDNPEENLKVIIDIINKAGESDPDVILLSELVYETCSVNIPIEEKSQPVPGYLTDTIGEYAKKYNTYIIFSMNEKDGDIIYNTAVIIGRDGKICGKYRKTHLPLFEAEWGTTPGNNTPVVFDLDFGRVGIIICYDQMFPENSRALALMGAEIIFLPTQGEHEILQRAIACSNGVYVAVSGYWSAEASRIIDPLGEILASVPDKDIAYVTQEVDLNRRFFTYWMSVGPANGENKVLFKKERMTENYDAINKESYKVKYSQKEFISCWKK